MYCTIDQARASGASGTDAEVTAAIGVATALIDAYTGTIWDVRPLAIVGRVEAGGEVFLPYVVQTVTAVAPIGAAPVDYPTGAYLVLSSTIPGQVDAVVLGARAWADPLIVGAEPWNGGWANLLGSTLATGQVKITGTFGPTPTPAPIVDAARALAAWRTSLGVLVTSPTTNTLEVDDEGDSMAIAVVTAEQAAAPRARTTGVATVDTLLDPFVRSPVLLGG